MTSKESPSSQQYPLEEEKKYPWDPGDHGPENLSFDPNPDLSELSFTFSLGEQSMKIIPLQKTIILPASNQECKSTVWL